MKKKKRRGLKWLLSALLGFVCALVLGALFYGTMVYQLTGEESAKESAADVQIAPLEQGKSAQELFPGPVLALRGTLVEEKAQDAEIGGSICRVITRTYALDGGARATAISAAPAQYLTRLADEGWTPQLITGFTLAGLDAVLERRGEESLLAARDGDAVYLLEAQADDQTLYALGVGASLE